MEARRWRRGGGVENYIAPTAAPLSRVGFYLTPGVWHFPSSLTFATYSPAENHTEHILRRQKPHHNARHPSPYPTACKSGTFQPYTTVLLHLLSPSPGLQPPTVVAFIIHISRLSTYSCVASNKCRQGNFSGQRYESKE